MDTAVNETTTTLGAELLFREHAAFVGSFLRRLGALPDEIDDLVQEVFLVVHRRGGFTPGAAQPRTWLAEIGRRLVCSMRRTSKRRQTTTTAPELVASVPATTASPFDTAAAVQALRRVQQAILALDLDHRTVFILYELEGDSCDSIAAAMEIPVGTVHSRLHVARRDFRIAYECLDREPRPEGAAPRAMKSDPIRLREDPSVPRERRQELGLFAITVYSDFDVSRGLARFRASVASIAHRSGTPATGSGAPPPPIALSMKLIAWIFSTALLSIGAAAWIASRATHQTVALSPSPALRTFTTITPDPPALSASVVSPTSPTTMPESLPAPAPPSPTTIAEALHVPTANVAAAPKRPTATGDKTDRPAHDAAFDELRQVARLRELSETNPAKAVALADEGNRMFPQGLLYQERESLAIRALVQVGRGSEAQARAQRLLDAFPRGPFSALVRRETGLEP